MGNHFRTSGAGDDAPKTQTGVQGSRFATPDSEGQPVAQAPAQPADQVQPASDPFAYNPTSDVALSGAAGFEPVQAVTARVEQPQAGAATPQPTMAGIPDPMAPATPAPQPAQSGLFAAIPDPTQPAAPVVESDQAAEVASLDNALNNPDFTSVFAPIDPQASRKKMAKQAGVEPVILMEHVTKIYPAQPTSLHSTTSTSRFIRASSSSWSVTPARVRPRCCRRSTATSSRRAAASWLPVRTS